MGPGAAGLAGAAGGFGISGGQGLVQFGELGLAFVLSMLIGLEREIRQKSAGLRTHTLVGVAAALIMLVSKYGFSDVLVPGRIVVDPSRVAAQVVSGIGFLGAGLIFVRRDVVRGLTTAAVVWLVAAIGMACGAGLPGLAAVVTAGYFIVLYPLPALVRLLPRAGITTSTLRIDYTDGLGVLRRVLEICTSQRFGVTELIVSRDGADAAASMLGDQGDVSFGAQDGQPGRVISVELALSGRSSIPALAGRLTEVEGVRTVRTVDPDR